MQGAQAAGGAAAALVLWSAQPGPGPTPVPEWGPATVWNYPVVLWQFAEAAFGGIVDLDLAADGYAGFWEVPAARFGDVAAGAWYAPDVAVVVAAGLMQGVGGGRFDPGGVATRAALAAVAARVATKRGWVPASVAAPPFSDVPARAWYAQAVAVAAAVGLMEGVGGGRFDRLTAASRAALAAVAARTAQRAGWAPASVPAPALSDVPVGAWYAQAVAVAVAAGLLRGEGDGHFDPGATATRAALAAVGARIAERAGWVPLPLTVPTSGVNPATPHPAAGPGARLGALWRGWLRALLGMRPVGRTASAVGCWPTHKSPFARSRFGRPGWPNGFRLRFSAHADFCSTLLR